MKPAFAIAALGFGVFFMMATQPATEIQTHKLLSDHKAMSAKCDSTPDKRVIPTQI